MQPKIHQTELGDFVILDQPETPFWWARFGSEEDARKAWDAYQQNKLDIIAGAQMGHYPES